MKFVEGRYQVSLRWNANHIEPCALLDQLQAFWELEAVGIQEEERTLYDEFVGVIKFVEGRYQVPLPWKEFHDLLPDNYQLSVI